MVGKSEAGSGKRETGAVSLIERSLHRWRRRVAREQITHIGLPGNVLFVCHGNVCRSPYAALAFKALLAPTIGRMIRVDSAGLAGPGLLSPATAIAAAAARGVDLSTHRSKPLTPDRATGMDVVVVMDGDQAATVARRATFARFLAISCSRSMIGTESIRHSHYIFSRGSIASRSPSPTRL